jgi:hypothetical protein
VNVWTTCKCGADLTKPDAYLYLTGGNRMCRVCAEQQGKNKNRTEHFAAGSFQG